MSVTAAEVVARARLLWPKLTTTAAPQETAEARVPTALKIVDEQAYNTSYLDGAAHMLAHLLYRADPMDLLGTGGSAGGAITSLKTSKLSVGYGDTGTGYAGSSAEMEKTAPGRELLMLRGSLAATMPRWIA